MGFETHQIQTKSSECGRLTVIAQGTNVSKLYKEGTVNQRFANSLWQALYWIYVVFVPYVMFSLLFPCRQFSIWIVNNSVNSGEVTPCSLIDKYRPTRRHIPVEYSNFQFQPLTALNPTRLKYFYYSGFQSDIFYSRLFTIKSFNRYENKSL